MAKKYRAKYSGNLYDTEEEAKQDNIAYLKANNKVIKKINLTNGDYISYEVTGNNDDGRWYKNGVPMSEDLQNVFTYVDKNKIRRSLGSGLHKYNENGKVVLYDANTPVYTPYWDRLLDDNVKNYKRFPKNYKTSKDVINLHTKGRMNLATIPLSVLDSIAINTGRSGTDIINNLGLIGKESTFGGRSNILYTKELKQRGYSKEEIDSIINRDMYVNDYGLTNNHAYLENKYTDYIGAINSAAANYSSEDDIQLAYIEKLAKDAYENNRIKDTTPHYHENAMADAFARYAAAPNRYNSGQHNYQQMVTNIGNEVFYEPQIQKYWNTRGKQYEAKGKAERKRSLEYGDRVDTVAKRYLDEQKTLYRDGGSIHIAPSKRGTFTAAATKRGMGVQEFASKVLRNKDNYSPSLVKKANFAHNASKWNH